MTPPKLPPAIAESTSTPRYTKRHGESAVSTAQHDEGCIWITAHDGRTLVVVQPCADGSPDHETADRILAALG